MKYDFFHVLHFIADTTLKKLFNDVMEWMKKEVKKNIRGSKCIGILHAQFTNNEEIYIIALSGNGHGLDVTATGEVEYKPTPYKARWESLHEYLKNNCDITNKVKVAEFDILHKACLVKHRQNIINDQEFINEWIKRLEFWIGEWYKLCNKANKDFAIKEFVGKGMKSTYLEQMKVEAPTEEKALERYDDIVDFVTDCIPDYLPKDKRPKNYELPIRMQMLKVLFTKTPYEIRTLFEEKLNSHKLNQYRQKFDELRKNFMNDYLPLLACWDASCWPVIYRCAYITSPLPARGLIVPVWNLNQFFSPRYFAYWCKVADLIWNMYKKEYEEKGLPKGYTSVSMIWGGILQGGPKFTTGIVNFFIQCAEDNALCTLDKYVNDNKNLTCQGVSWYAFDCQNKCQRKNCKDSNCPKKECKKYECYKKPLCPFCKVGFRNRVTEAFHTDKSHQFQLYIDGENVSDDSDEGDIDYVNLSFE